MIDYLFMYEHKARELDNLCLLSYELQRRGYSVEILNRFDYKRHNKYLLKKIKVVGIVAAYRDESLFAQAYQFVGKVNKIVNFRWEQAFSEGELEKDTFNKPKGRAKELTHICWGKVPFMQLKNENVKNAIITGPIHLDFCSEKFRGFYKTREEIKTEYHIKTKKILLYISSFSLASYSTEEIEYWEKFTGEELQDVVKQERLNQRVTIDWFLKLLEKDEDLSVIYRPHPAEKDSEIVKEASLKNERFLVISEEAVKQWIFISDYITTCFSTSIAEVFYAKKSIAILRPYPINEYNNPAIYIDSEYCKTFDEFMRFYNNKTEAFPIKEERIREYYDEQRDNLSYIRVADLFEEVYQSNVYDVKPSKGTAIRVFLCSIKAIIKKHLFYSKKRDNLIKVWPFKKLRFELNEFENYKKEIVNQKDIQKRINLIRKTLEMEK